MKIAILGPKGTYCDVAKNEYLKKNNLNMETIYYPSIIKSIDSLKFNDYALVPFENSLDGFIMESLDRIIIDKLFIVSQLKLSIDFAFVGNTNDIKKIKKIYCQFKAYGQCLDFIFENEFDVIKTESNIESLELLKSSKEPFGAIIPMHAINLYRFELVIPHIADSKNNETRFFVLNKELKQEELKEKLDASLVFSSIEDKPGILFNILKKFHDKNINLKSILSRPSKLNLGNYNFYIECSLLNKDLNKLYSLIDDFKNNPDCKISLLGIYNSL